MCTHSRCPLISVASRSRDSGSKNCAVIQLLKETRVHILPLMNPDGAAQAKLGECDSKRGKNNANNVDLNNNFPGDCTISRLFCAVAGVQLQVFTCLSLHLQQLKA